MYKYLVFILLISSSLVIGQEDQDPFDLSSIMDKLNENGVPTVESVDLLETKSWQLYLNKDWENAAEALHLYAMNANLLANLIKSGLDPYYGASYDDRKEFPYSKLKPLVKYETNTNAYIRSRNEAFVMEADCYLNMGDLKKAAALYRKALDHINIDNEILWDRARIGLYSIIGVNDE